MTTRHNIRFLTRVLASVALLELGGGCAGAVAMEPDASDTIALSIPVLDPEPVNGQTPPGVFMTMVLFFQDGEAHNASPCTGMREAGPWQVGDEVCFLLPSDAPGRLGAFRLIADELWLVNQGPL